MGQIRMRPVPASKRSWALSWNGNALAGPYTLASGVTNFDILTPDGSTPTAGNLLSHRYHHHCAAAIQNSRQWGMFSSGYGNETDGGIMCVGVTKLWTDTQWSAPFTMLEPQATFANNTVSDASSRLGYPACFLKKNGNVYAIICLQKGDDSEGLGLAARLCACNPDGSLNLGTPVLITAGTYTAQDGATQLNYDATLSALLLTDAILYLRWGGPSTVGFSPSWSYKYSVGNLTMVEPTTLYHDGVYLRLWRSTTTSVNFLWAQIKGPNDPDFCTPFVLDIPNAPSAVSLRRWTDGRLALMGNAQDYSFYQRDPLYLALINPVTFRTETLKAIRQGVTSSPTYPGTAKAGGASYVDHDEEDGKAFSIESIHKESVGGSQWLTSSIS